jgi:hypothetical protein
MSLESQLRWKKKAVQAYFDKVDKFLKQLLLLIVRTQLYSTAPIQPKR